MFLLGCPMWGYKEWVGNFFPAHTPSSDFLRLYSKRLNVVEGNTTFYALPAAETVVRWRLETPETFRFCPKLSRSISHEMLLDQSEKATQAFVTRMRGLGSRLGPFFLQLPPSFAPLHLPQLQTFLQFWPADLRLAVEVRHPDFFKEPYQSELHHVLTQQNVALVIMDTRPIRTGPTEEQQVLQARERKPNLPLRIAATTDFTFVRYIGHPRMEMNEPFLAQWTQQLADWLTQGITCYVFCHCPYEEHSPTLCANLYQRLQEHIPLPPLTWHPGQDDMQLEQGRLF